MKKITLLKEDQIVVYKSDLINLLTICKSAFQNGANAMIWFETENQRQQEIRDDYCRMYRHRADLLEKYINGLD